MEKSNKGFTLIEILVVIGIVAVLAAIVIVAINPARQFAQARNTQRQAGVNTILNAIGQRLADNKGIFTGTFSVGGSSYTCPALPALTGTPPTATVAVNTTNHVAADLPVTSGNLGCLAPTYVATIPVDPDPTLAVSPDTGYRVGVDATGRVIVCAPGGAEPSIPGSGPICVTR